MIIILWKTGRSSKASPVLQKLQATGELARPFTWEPDGRLRLLVEPSPGHRAENDKRNEQEKRRGRKHDVEYLEEFLAVALRGKEADSMPKRNTGQGVDVNEAPVAFKHTAESSRTTQQQSKPRRVAAVSFE